jgi:Zn finger protein HypA/HybF involved in hydrogenase expression
VVSAQHTSVISALEVRDDQDDEEYEEYEMECPDCQTLLTLYYSLDQPKYLCENCGVAIDGRSVFLME